MSERNDDVLALVRELIGKYPTVNSRQLYDKAVRVHPFLDEDGLRTFHARYVLPVRRAQAAAEGRPRAPRRKKHRTEVSTTAGSTETATSRRSARAAGIEADRMRVRTVLLRFARELSVAETRAEIVAMLSGVDRYVDEIITPSPQDVPGTSSPAA